MAKLIRWLVAIWLIGAIAIAALAAVSSFADEACRSKSAEAHLQSKFKAGTGCVVLVNGAWVPSTNVQSRVVLDAVVRDCRVEVKAAFEKLELPGRPYRRETTMATSVHAADPRGVRVRRETAEFIPPERNRRIFDHEGRPPTEVIRVGDRTFMRQSQLWLEGYNWMDRDTLPSGVGSPQTPFQCLGTVAFEDKTYAGYRTIDPRQGVVVVGKIDQKEVAANVTQQLTLWRTILVDGETGLPAYQIVAFANELDHPVWKMRYTYPRDITIEAPVQ
jgi:hypothetical protein